MLKLFEKIMYTRKKRTKQYRNDINDAWYKKYFKFIQDNPEKPWDWYGISENPNITMKIVLDNPDKPWNWDWISCNPNITWDIIKDNPKEYWNWYYISCNPNITWDIIRDNPDKPWDWVYISKNKLQKEKDLFFEEQRKRYLAAYKIQQFWYKHTLSPEYVIGRKFINKTYDELFA